MMRIPFVRLESTAAAMSDVAFRPRAVVAPVDRHPLIDEISLADLVAPSAIHIAVDQLVIDGQFARVLALVGLPSSVDAGWLEPLVAGSLPAEVSLFVVPAKRGDVAGQLTRRHVRLQSSLGHDLVRRATGRSGPGSRRGADRPVASRAGAWRRASV
jgi:hypothetical protein